MEVYIYIYISVLILSFCKKNKIIYLSFYMILLLLAGLRDVNIGTDTNSYLKIFGYINDGGGTSSYIASVIEPGWFALNWICSQLFKDFRAVMFLSSAIVLTPIFIRAWQEDKYTYWIILYYVLLYFYINSFNIIRQMIAVSIIFYAIDFLKNNMKIKFFILVFTATLFHYSALFCLTIPFIVKKIRLNGSIVIISLLLSYLIGIYILPSILPRIPYIGGYSHYLMDGNASGSSSRILLNLYFIFIYFSCNLKGNRFYFKLFFIGIILYNSLAFSPSIARVAQYFTIIQLLLLPKLTSNFHWNKIVLKLFAIIYASIYYFTMLHVNSGQVVPYKLF